MGLMQLNEFQSILVCPRCKHSLVQADGHYNCTNTGCAYANDLCFPVIAGQPVLVDFEHSILVENDLIGTSGASPITRRNRPWGKKIRDVLFSGSAVTGENAIRVRNLLKDMPGNPTILIVGGGSVGHGSEVLYGNPSLQIISFDIYYTPVTQFIADAHDIPIADASVDGVWIQAVLEHVLDPWRVVSEIYRVLKKNGLLYAETPFMQQVHSGPYDFTRFTESGHRWMFRKFDVIDSGVVQGPGTQLSWTIDHVSRGIFRSTRAGLIARALLFWVRYIDKIIPEDYAVDSASGVFFLGRKSEREITPREIVKYYKGAYQRRH